MRLALLFVGGVSVLFAALLAVQLLQPWSSGGDVADATGVVPISRVRLPASRPLASPTLVMHGDEWVATILARPLFTRDRRPVAATASAALGESNGNLPRLTGIAISPDQRRAIFAGADGAKPIVVEEGGSIAGFTVQAIAPDGVKVQGPDGDRTVALAFDQSPPAAHADADPQQPPGPPTGMPPPYPSFPQPGYPQPGQVMPNQGFGLGRPGPQLDPTGQPVPRPGFNRPRADLGGAGSVLQVRSS